MSLHCSFAIAVVRECSTARAQATCAVGVERDHVVFCGNAVHHARVPVVQNGGQVDEEDHRRAAVVPAELAIRKVHAACGDRLRAHGLRTRSSHPIHRQGGHLHRQSAADGSLSCRIHSSAGLDHVPHHNGVDGFRGQT